MDLGVSNAIDLTNLSTTERRTERRYGVVKKT